MIELLLLVLGIGVLELTICPVQLSCDLTVQVSDASTVVFARVHERQLSSGFGNRLGSLCDPGVVDMGIGVIWLSTARAGWFGLALEESPGTLEQGDELPEGLADLRQPWTRTVAEEQNAQTVVSLEHREFGPNNWDLYYFVSIPSTVKNAQQNCLYPGRGPRYNEAAAVQAEGGGDVPECAVAFLQNGAVVPNNACAPVLADAQEDTACVTTTGNDDDVRTENVSRCLDQMREQSTRVFKAEE